MPTTLRSTPPPSGWPLRKRSAMILVGVSQQAFFIMSGSHLLNMFVLFCNVKPDVKLSCVILGWINSCLSLSLWVWVWHYNSNSYVIVMIYEVGTPPRSACIAKHIHFTWKMKSPVHWKLVQESHPRIPACPESLEPPVQLRVMGK